MQEDYQHEPSVYGWMHCNSGLWGPSFGGLGNSEKWAELVCLSLLLVFCFAYSLEILL